METTKPQAAKANEPKAEKRYTAYAAYDNSPLFSTRATTIEAAYTTFNRLAIQNFWFLEVKYSFLNA
jgi:hypothetical protein